MIGSILPRVRRMKGRSMIGSILLRVRRMKGSNLPVAVAAAAAGVWVVSVVVMSVG